MLTKVGFFAWEAAWGESLTLDHLKQRGWTLANDVIFLEEKSTDHVLHYAKMRILWPLSFSLFKVE